MRAFLKLLSVAWLLAAAGSAAATEYQVFLGGGSDTFRPNDITIQKFSCMRRVISVGALCI